MAYYFLNENIKYFKITRNDIVFSEFIKTFDFIGNKIKEIKDFYFKIFIYSAIKIKNYKKNNIMTGNYGY